MRKEPYEEFKNIIEATCPICGKKFIPAPLHVYRDKRSMKRVCSWSCVCESERLKMGAKKQSKKGDDSK